MTDNATMNVVQAPLGNPGMLKNASAVPLENLCRQAQFAASSAKKTSPSNYVVPAQVVTQSPAESCERELLATMYGAWAPLVVDLAKPLCGQKVLDLACGTGAVARVAAKRTGITGSVIGVDVHPGMLAIARENADHNFDLSAASIEWREADASALPLDSNSIDVAYCQAGLQYFADKPAALRELHRVLTPGGRIGLMTWRSIDLSPGFRIFADVLEDHLGVSAAATVRLQFALSDTELDRLVRAANFRVVATQEHTGMVRFQSVQQLLRLFLSGSRVAAFLTQGSAVKREALVSKVTSALSRYVTRSGLAFSIAANLVSAAK